MSISYNNEHRMTKCGKPHLCLVKALARNADNLLQNVANIFRSTMTDRPKAVGNIVVERNRRRQYAAHTVVVDCGMATVHC